MSTPTDDGWLAGQMDLQALLRREDEAKAAKRSKERDAGRKEAPILRAVLDALCKLPYCDARRYSVGATQIEGRWQRFGVPGHSDVGATVQMLSGVGRAFFCEVKREKGGRVSPEQAAFLEKQHRYGAYCCVVRSGAEAVEHASRAREGLMGDPSQWRATR